MTLSANLGYPRIGKKRELKFGMEKYWRNKISLDDLISIAEIIQTSNWRIQKELDMDFIPSNDFSFYDQVLDTTVLLGAIPARFAEEQNLNDMDLYFAMARGHQSSNRKSIPAMEMTKWFNTNYHYIVPEINASTTFKLNADKPLKAYQSALKMEIQTRPVILGPVTFLSLSKSEETDFSPISKLNDTLPLYASLFKKLKDQGAEWIQLDEPVLTTDLDELHIKAYQQLFDYFRANPVGIKIMLTTYFGNLSVNANLAASSPFEGLHIDMTNCKNADVIFSILPQERFISLGLIDGRNIWKNDLNHSLAIMQKVTEKYSFQELVAAPSCSMLHIPQDLQMETGLDNEISTWLAFAEQKLREITELKKASNQNFQPTQAFFQNQEALENRKIFVEKGLIQNASVDIYKRSVFIDRKAKQKKKFELPVLPTTTIGSFPQTSAIRKLRADLRKGNINKSQYAASLKKELEKTIRFQEEIGLDVLVHGEFERNDMVQYFAEQMQGFLFTEKGWVQSFGSRCVRPPIIYGNVSRPNPMTIEWTTFAQSLTDKPVKGMLTGPVTILQWSFVRDDQPRSDTCRQIAYAIREEVLDLEKAGIGIIQIDEPALREGLPIQSRDWQTYLDWAVECFQISASGVADETQIHTHMCYAEFNDIIDAIARMDADVISIEASRSKMDLLDAFRKFNYPNDIGPGVYDIHSPNVPPSDEITALIQKALEVIPAQQLWVNPDCGLKTRQWDEVTMSLKNMIAAVKKVRSVLDKN